MPANRNPHCILWSRKIVICLASALALAAVSGCGPSDPYPVEKVSGKITYEDGSPIPAERIRLLFVPQVATVDPKTPPHNGTAEVNPKTGEFGSATTFRYKDGIIRGESKVVVQAAGKLVPDDYASEEKTPLKVNTSKLPFILKVPKPH